MLVALMLMLILMLMLLEDVASARAAAPCAVIDVSKTKDTLHDAQKLAREASASAPCVRVLLGERSFRLAEEPLVLSAADAHTSWEGGEVTTAVDVPSSLWRAVEGRSGRSLDVTGLVNRSEWGVVNGANGIVPSSHLRMLVQVRGSWRPMRVARWPNVPFDYGLVPPVNWTTVSKTCPCSGGPNGGCDAAHPPSQCGVGCKAFTWATDTDRPARWVAAAREGRLFIHGFFKFMWKDYFAPIINVDTSARQLTANLSIGGTYGITNDSFYYAYGMVEELDIEGEYILNSTTGELSAILPSECFSPAGMVLCPTRLVPASPIGRMSCCISGNCSMAAMVRVIGTHDISFLRMNLSGSVGVGLSVWGSSNITIESCNINNHADTGVIVGSAAANFSHCSTGDPARDSYGVHMVGSDVGYTGGGASSFTGGKRTALLPSHFQIENNWFHDFGQDIYTYKPGVLVAGVGVTVRKNEFRSSYHVALLFSGNDHLFELNDFHHVTTIGYDSGAIYAGRDLASRGTVIRHNLLHHLDNPAPCNAYSSCTRIGIYIDDNEGGVAVIGNIFYRVQRAFNSNCGGDFNISNNLFVSCQEAIHQGGNNLTGSRAAALLAGLEKFPFRSVRWQQHYPSLAKFKDWTVGDDPPGGCLDGPLNNSLATNVIVNFSKPFYWGECECCSNGYHRGDMAHRRWLPGFCNHQSNPKACPNEPNVGGMFALPTAWLNDTMHFIIKPGSNAIIPDPHFVSSNIETDLNFAFRPSSPAFNLGWEPIPEDQIGPSRKVLPL
eukprot:COSAG02_NODE_3571_length_6533_cov_8.215981_4_plen_779_part_00